MHTRQAASLSLVGLSATLPWLGLFCLGLLLPLTLRGDDLPEFDSENTATSVRVALNDDSQAEAAPKPIPRSELERLQPIAASEVQRLKELEGETRQVHGRVASTFIPEGGSPVILNFGDNFRTCFKVVIYRRQYQRWGRTAEEIAKLYEGAELLVEGTVSLYNELPQIELTSPTQVRQVAEE